MLLPVEWWLELEVPEHHVPSGRGGHQLALVQPDGVLRS